MKNKLVGEVFDHIYSPDLLLSLESIKGRRFKQIREAAEEAKRMGRRKVDVSSLLPQRMGDRELPETYKAEWKSVWGKAPPPLRAEAIRKMTFDQMRDFILFRAGDECAYIQQTKKSKPHPYSYSDKKLTTQMVDLAWRIISLCPKQTINVCQVMLHKEIPDEYVVLFREKLKRA